MTGRRKGRGVVWVAGAVAGLLLCGAALLAVRGDWRYRVWFALTPAQADVLTPAELRGETMTQTVSEWLSDARVTADDSLMLVNREHPLEEDYRPETETLGDWQMTAETRAAFEALRRRIERETGERLIIRSAYRSRQEQQEELTEEGSGVAANPGESEHETGLAIDVCVRGYGGQSFLKSAAGRLVNRSCAEEGFVVRYPIGKEPVTGFAFEPWHLRYVGAVHAQAMQDGKLTLEEYIEQLTPGQWFRCGDVRILRTGAGDADAVTLPTDFSSCTVSRDGCGCRIFTLLP